MNEENDRHELMLVRQGRGEALERLLQQHRERLKRIVALRINPRLNGRIDASDIIQEAFVEAVRTLDDYLAKPDFPVFLWLRHLARQKLIQAHRVHLGAACRGAHREVRMDGPTPLNTSASIAVQLLAGLTSPSAAAIKRENKQLLEAALARMDPLDQEVLVLRHFESLSGPETAQVLGISHDAVKKRYVRALVKLQKIMAAVSACL